MRVLIDLTLTVRERLKHGSSMRRAHEWQSSMRERLNQGAELDEEGAWVHMAYSYMRERKILWTSISLVLVKVGTSTKFSN